MQMTTKQGDKDMSGSTNTDKTNFSCQYCSSSNTIRYGTRTYSGRFFQKVKCGDCHKISQFEMSFMLDGEIIEENVKLSKQKQRFMDQNRIERKAFREYARTENAIGEYTKEIVKVLRENTFSKKTKGHVDNPLAGGIIQLSDIHFNELVDLIVNKYDFPTASRRLKYFVHQTKKYMKVNGVTTIVLAMTGDILNSDRRLDELLSQATNRAKATFIAVDILQQLILELNEDFNVIVTCVTRNESRIKDDWGWVDPVATDNYDFMVFNMLKLLFDEASGVQFIMGDPTEVVINIAGQNILFLHGHGSLPSSGTGIEKAILQLMGRYSARGITIRYVVYGHLHSARLSDWFARSSSATGANDYSEKALNLVGRASQNCHVVFSNGNIDSMKVDLQELVVPKGYNFDESLEAYNPKSLDKTKPNKVVFQVTI